AGDYANGHARRRLHAGDERDGAQVGAGAAGADGHAHDDRVRGEIAVADGGEEVVGGGELVHTSALGAVVLGQLGERDAVHAVQLLVEQVAALRDVLLATLPLEPLPDALLGGRALDIAQPVAARSVRSLGGHDFDDLAVV